MKSLKILVCFAAVLSILLSACSQTPAEESAPPAGESGAVTLKFQGPGNAAEYELDKKIAADFTAETGIKVEVVQGPDSTTDRLNEYLVLLGNEVKEFDVYQIDVIWPGILAEHMVDLNQALGEEAKSHFPTIIENNTVEGKLVGMPWYTDAGLLYYRSDLLAKYGYDHPPETWDELEAMAQTIQEGERADGNGDFWGFVWQGNNYEGLTCDALEWQVSHGGGQIIEPNGTVSVNNPESIAAFEQAAGWVGTISPPDVTKFLEEDSREVWQAGNAAFMRNWPYAYALGNSADSPIKDKFEVTLLPSGGAGHAATLGGWQLAVSNYSEHPQEAIEFVKYMTSPEVQRRRAIEAAYAPTIPELYDDAEVVEANPYYTTLKDVFFGEAVARPSSVSGEAYAEVSYDYFEAVHSILTGEKSAAQAMADLDAKWSGLAETEAAIGPVTLTFQGPGNAAEYELDKKIAADFTAETGIKVEVVQGPDSTTDRLNEYLVLLGNEVKEFDVYQIDVIWPGILAEHMVDLNQALGEEAKSHFPTIIENNTVEGKLVGMPWYTDAGLLYYRSDLLAKYGYDHPPETWDELEAMAQTIQEGERADGNGDFWGFVWQGNNYEGLTCDALEWQVSHGGGQIIEPNGTVSVNNPESIAAFEQAAGWVGTISPPDVTKFLEEDSREVWQAGNAAFMRNWPYAYALGNSADSPIKDKFEVTLLPSGGAGHAATLGGWQLAVSNYSEHPQEAIEFVKYMTSPEVQRRRAIEAAYAPTIPELYDDAEVVEANPYYTTLKDVFFGEAVARPSSVSGEAYAEVSYDYFEAVHSILTGEKSAAQALIELETKLAVDASTSPTP